MTKRVFENSMVAHVWAQRTQDSGRSSNGNFYFDGDAIYSSGRHFCIATFTTTLPDASGFGEAVVLMTTRGYSNSTSKHIMYTRRAVPSQYKMLMVPNPDASMERNISSIMADAEQVLKEASKPRKRQATKDAAVSQFLRALEHCNELGRLFIVDYQPIAAPADASFTALAEGVREREEAAKQARMKQQALQVKRQEQEALAWFKSEHGGVAEYVRKWRLGLVPPSLPYQMQSLSKAQQLVAGYEPGMQWMRAIIGHDVQTSMGATFPVSHAIKAWPIIKRAIAKVIESNETMHLETSPKLGHFQVGTIDARGWVTAGCHNIRFAEVEALAASLGLE